ncbi:MAG: HPr family phosphocarrier protein [Selenomonadaceae bacterium]|nr:HPr family phosphocarrier protein [Selenomonadaceae bacterium]
MSDEKIFEDEIMSDEELDKVAGGMYEATITIRDKDGIHARPAGQLIKLAKQFQSTNIFIEKNDKNVSATNMMKLMGLGVKNGNEIKIIADGPDEKEAVKTLTDFINNNFGKN